MIFTRASVSTSGFQRSLNSLLELKKDTPKIVRRVAGNVAKDCVKLTPPFGGNPSTETFNEQRRVGRRAIEKDLGRLFESVRDLDIVKNATKGGAGKRLVKLAREGNTQGVVDLLNGLKIRSQAFEPTPQVEAHLKNRNSLGRVKSITGSPVFVLDGVKDFIAGVQQRIGSAKHGWMAAISTLGVKGIPAWVRNQSTSSGRCVVEGEGTSKFSVMFENTVPYIQSRGRDLSIVKSAFQSTAVRLGKEVQAVLSARMRKAKRA